MIPEFGHFAIILALCLAIMQFFLPLLGAARNHMTLMRLSHYTAIGQLLFVGISFVVLAVCFVQNDFSVAYVAENSNSQLPILYRLCAIWGAHEGSLLLWVFILTLWMAMVSLFSDNLPRPFVARVLSVLGFIGIGFYGFLLTTSNPFRRFLPNFPVDGHDLNPILQDPGLVIHPPMLYMGYVGFSVAFAFAISALLGARMDAQWARWARPWTLIAWSFLTLGIVLGSWWAYRELGWGGWWFWDPVENASFLPWLAGTALIHSLVVSEKRNSFKAWTVLLAVCTFSLSLLGTFIVRSGVLISVHAFAQDPRRGLYVLQFLVTVIGLSLALYAWRGRRIITSNYFSFWSRETLLLSNNVILFVAMLTVLLGTLYPLVIEGLHLGKLSVGAPYFNTVFFPLMVPLLMLMGVAPFFRWQNAQPADFIKRFFWIFLLSSFMAFLLPWLVGAEFKASVMMGLLLAFWVVTSTFSYFYLPRQKILFRIRHFSSSQWAMVLAHLGVAICAIGIVLTTAYSQDRNLSMRVGDEVQVAGYRFHFKTIVDLVGPNYSGQKATILVSKGRKLIKVLQPQQRQYTVQNTALAKTDIDAGIFRDLYVALGPPIGKGAWAVRIYYKPFVRWIWSGGLLIAFAGMIGVLDRRYRRRK